MIKGYVRYCDRCGVELTKANNTCGFELCDKCNEALEQQLAIKNDLGVDLISRKQAIEEADKLTLETGYDNEKVEEMLRDLPSVTLQEPKILALLDKTFDDFCNCPGGESYFHIDGEDYNTDAVYALEGMEIFIKVLKKRLVKSEE